MIAKKLQQEKESIYQHKSVPEFYSAHVYIDLGRQYRKFYRKSSKKICHC